MSKEVISTNLKRYEKLNENTYKILVSYYFSGSKAEKEALGEKSFSPIIEKMFGDEVKVIEGTLVDYNAIPGNYKTCLVKSSVRIIPVSTASLASIIDQKGFSTVAKNTFVDPATNSIWKKIVTDSGVTQLVQTQVENLEAMIKQCLDISEVVASARPLFALKSEKFDYALFYNPASQKVEAGVVLEADESNSTIVSRQAKAKISLSNHYLVTVAGVAELISQFEKELKNAKGATDVMEAYINFWFDSSEGKEASKFIEKELTHNVLKASASLEDSSDDASNLVTSIKADIDSADENADSITPTKEQIEAILTTKFDADRISNFAFAEEGGKDKFILKFTKPVSIDDISYILYTIKEVFKIAPEMTTTSEFVNIALNFNK